MIAAPVPTPTPEPLRHLVVLGHPSPNSFNRAIAETYCAATRDCGQIPMLRDLYAQGFDPRLQADERLAAEIEHRPDVAAELELVHSADAIVLVYPIWFGMPPAMIKGYIDRVLGAGFRAEALKARRPHPLLAGKRLLILSSSATTRPWLEQKGQWLALRQAFDNYLVEAFQMHSSHHVHFDAVVEGMPESAVYEHLETARGAAFELSSQLLHERHAAQAQAAVARRRAAQALAAETVAHDS
ncbi:NAD(P)H-dependent oxidoreductase [Sphingomonas sp. CJ20]